MANTIRVYKSEGVWVAKRDSATRAAGRFSTQKEAYLRAREIALNNGLTITVYYPNGGIKAVVNPRNREEEGNCFLTTACIKYYGLKDDCYELKTLREFRDNYLLSSTQGKELVKQYYKVAPIIVKSLEADSRRKILFEEIFSQIKLACLAIERGEFDNATKIYESAVINLYQKYCKALWL